VQTETGHRSTPPGRQRAKAEHGGANRPHHHSTGTPKTAASSAGSNTRRRKPATAALAHLAATDSRSTESGKRWRRWWRPHRSSSPAHCNSGPSAIDPRASWRFEKRQFPSKRSLPGEDAVGRSRHATAATRARDKCPDAGEEHERHRASDLNSRAGVGWPRRDQERKTGEVLLRDRAACYEKRPGAG
jgi:hypothetical protein